MASSHSHHEEGLRLIVDTIQEDAETREQQYNAIHHSPASYTTMPTSSSVSSLHSSSTPPGALPPILQYDSEPRRLVPVYIIVIFLLLLLGNAICFSIKPFLSENDGAQLQKYTLLVDLAMVGLLCIMLLMRLFVRLMFFLSKRYSAIRHLFHVCLSFEHPLVWMLWSLYMIGAYLLLEDNVSDKISHITLRLIIAMVAVSVLYLAKVSVIVVLEVVSYGDLMDQQIENSTIDSVLHELESNAGLQLQSGRRMIASRALKALGEARHQGRVPQVARDISSEILADRGAGKGYLIQSDLERILTSSASVPIALSYFGESVSLPDGAQSRRITENSLTHALVKLFFSREDMNNMLKSRRLLINVLDTLLIGMFAVGAVLIFLVALEVAVTTLMVSMGTLLLSVSFAYAATLQELFDSLYMIFVMKPFNIGDMVLISEGSPLQVEYVGLLGTVFISATGHAVYYRNALIARGKIANLNRCYFLQLEHKFRVRNSATVAEFAQLEHLLREYFRSHEVWSTRFELSASQIMAEGASIEFTLRCRIDQGSWQARTNWVGHNTHLILELEEMVNRLNLGPSKKE